MQGKAAVLVPDIALVKRLQDELRQREALAKAQGKPLEPKFLMPVYKRLYEILKQNYLNDFFQRVLKIPTKIFRYHSCAQGLRFSSVGDDFTDEAGEPSSAKRRSNSIALLRQNDAQKTHQKFNVIETILNKHRRKKFNLQMAKPVVPNPVKRKPKEPIYFEQTKRVTVTNSLLESPITEPSSPAPKSASATKDSPVELRIRAISSSPQQQAEPSM